MLWIGLASCTFLVFVLWALVVVGKDADKQMERITRKK